MASHIRLGTGALIMGFGLPVYPLSMIFSQSGHYLANVPVDIRDKFGHSVLHAVSDGPIMLFRLPAGEYCVIAQMNGKTLQADVRVNAAGDSRLSFDWPRA